MENNSSSGRRKAWRCYLFILGIIVAIVVGINLFSIVSQPDGANSAPSVHLGSETQIVVIIFLAVAFVGMVLIVGFLAKYSSQLDTSPRPRIQASVPLISLLVFLVSFIALEGLALVILTLAGLKSESNAGVLAQLVLQMLSILGAYALGTSAFRFMVAYTNEDPSEIGWRPFSLIQAIKWGMGGYCAVLPLLVIMLIISQAIFRNMKTPAHPIMESVMEGGGAYILAFILAAVVAPLVEETFFRGMLYTSMRSRMGVWPAAVLSGAIFAAVHPTLPAGFLPITALGVALALLREKTGSMLPSMICHGINNAVALILVRLMY